MTNKRLLFWCLFLVGLAIILGYAIYIAFAPPGGEGTVDERLPPKPSPIPIPTSPLEPLRNAWNSEEYANWPVAELLALICETSYLPPVDVEPNYKTLGFSKITTIVDGSMIGYVASSDDVTVIVFRGTDNNIDWIVNLDIGSVPTANGSIHRGFYNAYRPLQSQIMKILKANKTKHLWIVGHSLGGALAVVCAYDLIENEGLDVDGIITFGQPMTVKQQLGDYLGTKLLGRYAHYVNNNDIVARVPPTFSHFGSLVWFTESGVKRSKPKRMVFGAEGNEEAANVEGAEVVPVSVEEFEELKASLGGKEVTPSVSPDGTPIYKGNSPWIENHGMKFYLEKIRRVTNELPN